MSLRPVAFHESISKDKLAELFKLEKYQLFAAPPTPVHCKKCGTMYAVFLPRDNDPQNGPYIAELEDRISSGCDRGNHSSLEVSLDETVS